MSFVEIVVEFDIPKKHFLKFLKFRSYIFLFIMVQSLQNLTRHLLKTCYQNNLKV